MEKANASLHKKISLYALELWSWYEGFLERRTGLRKRAQPRLFSLVEILGAPLILAALFVPSGTLNPSAFMAAVGMTSQYEAIPATGGLNCRQFNPDEWVQEYGKLDFDGSTWAIPQGASGGLIRLDSPVAINSDLEVVFVPTSEKQVNFVITMHDVYELTIGDGGYQGVTLKTVRGNGQPMRLTPTVDGERRVVFENGQLEPGADVRVVLNQGVSRMENGAYELNLRLARTSFLDGSAAPSTVFATYSFPLPPQFVYRDDTTYLSLGLRSSSDTSRVSVEILCVEFEEPKAR